MESTRAIMIAIVISLTAASVLFGVVATATAEWMHSKPLQTNFGLFKVCVTVSNVNDCSNYPSAEVLSYLHAVRAFVIMGDILLALALPLTVLHALGKLKSGNKIIAAVLAVAGLFFVIACSVYTGKTRSYSFFEYGYSFGLAWASGSIALVVAIIAFFATSGDYLPLP